MDYVLTVLVSLAIIAFVLTVTLGAFGVNVGFLSVFGGVFVANFVIRLLKA